MQEANEHEAVAGSFSNGGCMKLKAFPFLTMALLIGITIERVASPKTQETINERQKANQVEPGRAASEPMPAAMNSSQTRSLYRGARPVISSAPSSVQRGQNFIIGSPDSAMITKVVLARPMAVTHQTDSEQKILEMPYVQNSFSIFGTISTSGAVTDRFGVGDNFDALTFAAGNQGYGLNLFYYLRHVPYRVFLAADDRQYLVSLKLRDSENCYSSMVEPTTRMGCLFEPSSDGIPGDLLYSGDRRLVRFLDTQGGNFVEGRATVLESMVRCTGIRGECLAASRGEARDVSEQIVRVLLSEGISSEGRHHIPRGHRVIAKPVLGGLRHEYELENIAA
jgi:Galactose oxidase-like, Early set domain